MQPLIGIPAATLSPPPVPDTPYYRFNGYYTEALAASGALPVVIPLDLPDGTLRALFRRLDGLCLAGGDDVNPACYGEPPHSRLGETDPSRDDAELALTRWALETGLPVLGICRGIQLLNVAGGGSLVQDIAAQRPSATQHDYQPSQVPWARATHRVVVEAGSRLGAILGTTEVATNSFHHQAVGRVAPGFRAVAWAGDGIIEGIEDPSQGFTIGVQWHPEGMFEDDPASQRLFAAFAAACRKPARPSLPVTKPSLRVNGGTR